MSGGRCRSFVCGPGRTVRYPLDLTCHPTPNLCSQPSTLKSLSQTGGSGQKALAAQRAPTALPCESGHNRSPETQDLLRTWSHSGAATVLRLSPRLLKSCNFTSESSRSWGLWSRVHRRPQLELWTQMWMHLSMAFMRGSIPNILVDHFALSKSSLALPGIQAQP